MYNICRVNYVFSELTRESPQVFHRFLFKIYAEML